MADLPRELSRSSLLKSLRPGIHGRDLVGPARQDAMVLAVLLFFFRDLVVESDVVVRSIT